MYLSNQPSDSKNTTRDQAARTSSIAKNRCVIPHDVPDVTSRKERAQPTSLKLTELDTTVNVVPAIGSHRCREPNPTPLPPTEMQHNQMN
eukprot:scaffold67476_cov64-Attheya_sp.AAC.1